MGATQSKDDSCCQFGVPKTAWVSDSVSDNISTVTPTKKPSRLAVGNLVELTADYANFGDASEGPMSLGDTATISQDDLDDKPYKVKVLTGKNMGKEWFYAEGSLRVIVSDDPIPPAQTVEIQSMKVPGVVESSHPYSENTNDYLIVNVPGAVLYTVEFDEQSSTEKDFDFLRFYKDESKTSYWGAEKYTGGHNFTKRNFPGVGINPPLIIPASSFIIFFHSDMSSSSWGYKLKVEASPELIVGMPVRSINSIIFVCHVVKTVTAWQRWCIRTLPSSRFLYIYAGDLQMERNYWKYLPWQNYRNQ